MHKVVFNFLRRPAGEKLLAVEALWYLTLFKVLLKINSFNTLTKRYDLKLTQAENHEIISDMQTLKSVRWAVWRVSRIVPWRSVCLDQALAAQRMLSHRKISGILYLGVAKKEDARLKAHAWVRCNDQFITGRAGHEEFTIVSRFIW